MAGKVTVDWTAHAFGVRADELVETIHAEGAGLVEGMDFFYDDGLVRITFKDQLRILRNTKGILLSMSGLRWVRHDTCCCMGGVPSGFLPLDAHSAFV